MEHKIIAAGMEDGCISIFDLCGNHILTDRKSNSKILSLNYIVDRHQIRAFTAENEVLLFTDIKRSKETIDLTTKRLIARGGKRFNRDYVKGLVAKVDPKRYQTYVTA